MPKMKSHRGACKRFKTTASGKEYRLLLAMYSGTIRLIDNAKIIA